MRIVIRADEHLAQYGNQLGSGLGAAAHAEELGIAP